MSFHAIIVSVISILATFIQTEFQSKSSSLFDTHYWTMSIFFVVLFTFAVALTWPTLQVQAQAQSRVRNDNNHGVVLTTNLALLSGSLASSLLLLIIHQVLGWVAVVFWTLYFVKTAYDQLVLLHDVFYQLLQKLNNIICGQSRELQPEPEAPLQEPVSVVLTVQEPAAGAGTGAGAGPGPRSQDGEN